MHNENTYCHMSDACKLLKEKEQLVLQFKAANEKKNEFLKKIGIYATGEFHRIDYYIDKLVAENDKLKRYKDSKQASYERMQRMWNETEQENRELKQKLKEIESKFGIKIISYKEGKNLYCSTRIAELVQALRDIGKILNSKVIPVHTAREKQIISKIKEVLDVEHD